MSAGDGRTSYPILRDLARWGGVRLYIDCDNPWFWVNLLKAKTNETYYALAARLIMFPRGGIRIRTWSITAQSHFSHYPMDGIK